MSPLEAMLDIESARHACDLEAHALRLWPVLDPDALARLDCDPERITRYIATRTDLSAAAVRAALDKPQASAEDVWFG